MEKLRAFKTSHPVVFSFLCILATDLYFIPLKLWFPLDDAGNIHCLIRELIVAVFSVALVFIASQTHIYKCGAKNLFRSLWSGFIIIVVAGLGSFAFISDGIYANTAFKSPSDITAFAVFLLLIGIAEESVCRGIITDVLIERFGKTRGGVWLSAVLSGLFFGLFHATNIFGQSLGETVIQVIATGMTGILLSAIYIRHRNIFAVMLLHSIFDFMPMTEGGLFAGRTIIEPAVAPENFDFFNELLWAVIAQGVFVLAAMFILRPKIAKRIAENNANA